MAGDTRQTLAGLKPLMVSFSFSLLGKDFELGEILHVYLYLLKQNHTMIHRVQKEQTPCHPAHCHPSTLPELFETINEILKPSSC